MSLLAKANEGNFEIAPAGTHVAICRAVVDMGLQEVNWQGNAKMVHKVWIAWELSDELMEDGRPFQVSNRYTLSLGSKAKLREHLDAWRGKKFTEEELKGFDLFNVLGAPCMITVTHSDGEKVYANVAAVTAMPKGMPKPELHNELLKFSLEEYSADEFEKLPDWLQEKVNRVGLAVDNTQPSTEIEEDDLPF